MAKHEHLYVDHIIIHGSFDDVMLSHDLWVNVGCDFTYVIKAILVVNVGYKCFIVANRHFSFHVCKVIYDKKNEKGLTKIFHRSNWLHKNHQMYRVL